MRLSGRLCELPLFSVGLLSPGMLGLSLPSPFILALRAVRLGTVLAADVLHACGGALALPRPHLGFHYRSARCVVGRYCSGGRVACGGALALPQPHSGACKSHGKARSQAGNALLRV